MDVACIPASWLERNLLLPSPRHPFSCNGGTRKVGPGKLRHNPNRLVTVRNRLVELHLCTVGVGARIINPAHRSAGDGWPA